MLDVMLLATYNLCVCCIHLLVTQRLVAAGEVWRAEVRAMAAEGTKGAANTRTGAGPGAGSTRGSGRGPAAQGASDASGGSKGGVSLRRVELLIADGERMPFELEEVRAWH